MSELLEKAETTIQQEVDRNYLIEKYSLRDAKQIDFVLEYIKTRNQVTAYRKVYGKKMSANVAAAASSRMLRNVKIELIDILNMTGHSDTDIAEALTKLKNSSPDKYLSHIEKLRGLDIQKIEQKSEVTIKYEKEFDE